MSKYPGQDEQRKKFVKSIRRRNQMVDAYDATMRQGCWNRARILLLIGSLLILLVFLGYLLAR